MLVGDLIVGCRELIPDLPRGLAPLTGLGAASAVAAGSTLPAGTYNLQLCAYNRWGQTIGSNIVTGIVVPAGYGIAINSPVNSAWPPGTLGVNVYFGIQGQPLTQMVQSQVVPFVISAPGLPGMPATRNTAFYPDADGNTWSAATLYRWLNEALITASSVAGGIPDMGGVQAIAGQGLYYLPGRWKKLWNAWFDGFPIALAGGNDMFYRNVLTGFSFLAAIHYNAERVGIEFQPTCNQSGGSGTVASQISVGDTNLNINGLGSFYMALGLAQLGTPANNEIIAYSLLSGTQLTGCIRGLCGTVEQAWPANTPVAELNIRIRGQRIFDSPTFFPGMSQNSINVPSGWQRPLIDYMLNKSREGEQSPQEAQRKLQEFSGLIKSAINTGTELVGGPRQVGGTSYPGDGVPTSGGFRIIVP